jgi:hypothetical protein
MIYECLCKTYKLVLGSLLAWRLKSACRGKVCHRPGVGIYLACYFVNKHASKCIALQWKASSTAREVVMRKMKTRIDYELAAVARSRTGAELATAHQIYNSGQR